MNELAVELARARHGQHLCLVYEDHQEQMEAIVPFLQAGLAAGERCIYFADDRTIEEVKEVLRSAGVDVEAECRRGALLLLTKRETYLRNGTFVPAEMSSFIKESIKSAVADGFSGARVTGEMTWALGPEPGCERLIEYESQLNHVLPQLEGITVCQYHRKRFSAPIIRDVLRTHPIAILGNQVCSNLYYEPPEVIFEEDREEKRVQWMIDQLRRTRTAEQQLQEAVRMRDTFLAIASHELRTPLTSLRLQVQALTRYSRETNGEPFSPERLASKLEVLQRQATRLEGLVGELLNVSQLSTRQLTIHAQPMELSSAIARVVERLERSVERAGSTLVVHTQPLYGAWDRSAFEQALLNLLTNALKYGAGKPIHVTAARSGDEAWIAVRDHGIGIAPEDQARIFERFERAVSERHYGGFGIGLWIARELVQAMGGQVEVESALGHGATFTVRLPLTPSDRAVVAH